MRKADLRKNHQEFLQILTDDVEVLVRLLSAQRVVWARDKREIGESVLLRLCAHWESFVEKEMVDCTNIDCSRLAEQVGVRLPKHLTLAMCEAILTGGRYLNWRSTGELKGLAKRVLPDNVNPFAKITAATQRKIDEIYVIRNYISHQSKASRRALIKMYETEYGLVRFREPGAFLLANKGSRLIDYGTAFAIASIEMAQIFL